VETYLALSKSAVLFRRNKKKQKIPTSRLHPLRFLRAVERTELPHKAGHRTTCVGIPRAPNIIQNVIKQIPIPVLGDGVLPGMFGREGDKVTREWRKIHNKDLNDLNTSPNIVWVIK
jgi:hypothetical protein